jgi:hypothetical protein
MNHITSNLLNKILNFNDELTTNNIYNLFNDNTFEIKNINVFVDYISHLTLEFIDQNKDDNLYLFILKINEYSGFNTFTNYMIDLCFSIFIKEKCSKVTSNFTELDILIKSFNKKFFYNKINISKLYKLLDYDINISWIASIYNKNINTKVICLNDSKLIPILLCSNNLQLVKNINDYIKINSNGDKLLIDKYVYTFSFINRINKNHSIMYNLQKCILHEQLLNFMYIITNILSIIYRYDDKNKVYNEIKGSLLKIIINESNKIYVSKNNYDKDKTLINFLYEFLNNVILLQESDLLDGDVVQNMIINDIIQKIKVSFNEIKADDKDI